MRAVHHSVEADSSNEEIVETDGPFRNMHDEEVVERALSENGTLLWTDQGQVKIIIIFFS